MKKLLFLLFLTAQVSAQSYSVKKGMVTDSIRVSDTIQESFSVYLPTQYTEQQKWPLLLILDPEGRGRTAAQLFRNAAERQGYILASSNDMDKEKDLVENVKSGVRLLSAVSGMFSIDSRQVATAGSMEASYVASSMPMLYKGLLGGIVVGNQWIYSQHVGEVKDFLFVGMVGDEHMSAPDRTLAGLRGADIQVYTYPGNGDWPSSRMVESALASLTLRAMKKGVRGKDPALVEELYVQDLALVNAMISKEQLMEAFNFLNLMEKKYKDLLPLSEVEDKLKQLDRSRNFQEQKKELEKVLKKEQRLARDFTFYMEEDIRTENFENLGWWNYQKIQLDSLVKKGGAEAKMATRMQSRISVLADMHREILKDNHASLEKKLLVNMIHTIFEPTNFKAYKNIISLSAEDDDFATALFYLEEMLKHGYKDMEKLYEIEGTLGLRLTPEYNMLIEKYLGSSRFYDEQ